MKYVSCDFDLNIYLVYVYIRLSACPSDPSNHDNIVILIINHPLRYEDQAIIVGRPFDGGGWGGESASSLFC